MPWANHSLTLLLALPVALFVFAVDPLIWRRGRLVFGCVAALAITLVAVYAELPLRAGIFRAPLVYGRPETWDGFWYVALGEQFRGSIEDPFGGWPRKAGELVSRTVTQFGILAPLIPVGFVATVLRRPRYALLTGSAVLITCFFAASYLNAEIERYYLVPVLMAWTWLAILASMAVDVVAAATGEPLSDHQEPAAGPIPTRRPVGTISAMAAVGLAILLLAPTVLDLGRRFDTVDHRAAVQGQAFADHVMETLEPGAMIVSWWSYSTPLWYAQLVDGRRPDIAIIDDRTRLDENLGDLTDVIDANLGKRPVYVIRFDPLEVAALANRYDLRVHRRFRCHDADARRRPQGRVVTVESLEGAPAASRSARVGQLTYFFPAHNEEANLEGLVAEALETLPTLADEFEIIAVDDGSTDRTAEIAERLAAAHPGVVRVVHHAVNQGYGAALRSGFAAARYDLIAFTDGDRQFRVADIGRLTARLAEADHPDVVVGYRIKRADPPLRIVYARLYRLANRLFFGLRVTDVDGACKLFRRAALDGLAVESGGAFFSAELLIKLRAAGRTVVEVGVPHYPRTAGSPTGAKPQVIGRAVRDFWRLRLRMWVNRRRALRRGTRILGTPR